MKAAVHIQTGSHGQHTLLKTAYYTPPFRVADITEDRNAGKLELMLMNSSPGILDGDQYKIVVEIADGGSLRLHTQAYQRLFNMKNGAAQSMEVRMHPNSSFCYIPHPSVPHEASIFTSANKFFLQDNSCLVFGEILTCGRKLNGEVFLFSKYHSITEVFLNDKLILKENLLLVPLMDNVNVIGQLEGFTHQASLIYLHASIETKPLIENLSAYLQAQEGICFGTTTAPAGGLVIRLLGNKAEQLYNCLLVISSMLPSA